MSFWCGSAKAARIAGAYAYRGEKGKLARKGPPPPTGPPGTCDGSGGLMVRKTHLLRLFNNAKNDHFTKTGSGQT
eukprot:COSAG06_NODE_753_length_12547_cov_928.116244_11_plen_75_part_00